MRRERSRLPYKILGGWKRHGFLRSFAAAVPVSYELKNAIVSTSCSGSQMGGMGVLGSPFMMDVYGDNKGIIADGVPEIEAYIKEVLPDPEKMERFQKELLEIVADVTEFLPDTGQNKRTNVCHTLYFLYGIWYSNCEQNSSWPHFVTILGKATTKIKSSTTNFCLIGDFFTMKVLTGRRKAAHVYMQSIPDIGRPGRYEQVER